MDEDRAFLSTLQAPHTYENSKRPKSGDGAARASSQTSRADDDGRMDSHEPKPTWSGASTTLHRSPYILFVVTIYASLATISWTIICVLTYKPINRKTYSFSNRIGWLDEESYLKNEDIFRVMRVIQAIVGLLTIPITSAACACAAVAYVQHNKHSLGMSMRQTMALADRGWTDPATFPRLFSSPRGYKRMGSVFLLFAMALHLIGGIIAPLQQILMTTKSIRTPGGVSQKLYHLLDTPDQFRYSDDAESQLTILMTREALSTSKSTEPVAQFWHGDKFDCATVNTSESDATFATMISACGYGATLGRLAWDHDPFLAELPSTFTSGLIRQFAPRFNSSATYQPVDVELYPQDCASIDGSYFVRYESSLNDTDTPWFLEVCMPGDQRQSPWTNTRARQDFGEELFVNVSQSPASSSGSIYRLSVNTTGGYFELPNDLNGVLPGPLLEEDPWHQCDSHCQAQGMVVGDNGLDINTVIWDHSDPEQQSTMYYPDMRKRSIADVETISELQNKGPLLTIALALFGEGSFIGNRVAYPDSIIDAAQRLPNNTCTGFAPLHYFLQETSGFTSWQDSDDPSCIISNATRNEADVDLQIRSWIRIFDNLDNERLTAAMNAAAFLATKAWMDNQVPSIGHSLSVEYDFGTETLIPSISLAGIVVISALYLLFLLSLLATAAYASFTPRWTHSLDAFTMMRLGAAMGEEKLPLLVGRRQGSVRALDDTPGWLGDGHDEAEVGRLSLGATSALRRGRRYASYDGDDEPVVHSDSRDQFLAYRMREIQEDLADTRHVR